MNTYSEFALVPIENASDTVSIEPLTGIIIAKLTTVFFERIKSLLSP